MSVHHAPQPIGIAPDALFAPADGLTYTREDRKRAFSQQPLEGPILPELYLVPEKTSTLKPPVLHYGWKVGHEHLMKVVVKCWPKAIKRCIGRDIWVCSDPTWLENIPDEDDSDDAESDEDDSEDSEDEGMTARPSISDTLYNPDLPFLICRWLELPEELAYAFNVHEFQDASGREIGLSVGSNYHGVLKEPYFSTLKNVISPNEDPKWYLDQMRWKWRREAVVQSSSKDRPATYAGPRVRVAS